MKLFIDGKITGAPEEQPWLDLLRMLPGYDPLAQAESCWFDPDAAQLYLDFFPEMLQHIEGPKTGEPFILEPWQQSYIGNLFGWKMLDDSGRVVRRYRESLLYVPRGNGKTPLSAGITLACLIIDGEGGAQCYSAAGEREQAALLFRHASNMVLRNPKLDSKCRIYVTSKSIVLLRDQASFYRAISADAKTKHGYNAHCVVIDELHVQPNRELVDTLITSTKKKRRQPLIVYITTADWNRESICNEVYDYACKVRDGAVPGQRFLPAIYEASMEDDWLKQEIWQKANPNLGVSISVKDFRETIEKAVDVPALQASTLRLHLNVRTQSDTRAIDAAQWKRCGHGVTDAVAWRAEMLESLQGRPCIAGIDLGSKNDLSALALLFYQEPKPYPVLPWFWITEDSLRRRRKSREPWDVWVKQGFITLTRGNVTDYDTIRELITGVCAADVTDKHREQAEENSLIRQFEITQLQADVLFQGMQLATQLLGDGIKAEEFPQGWKTMAPATKTTLDWIGNGDVAHGNNPVLTWMAGNASAEEDGAGNLKFVKDKSGDKIDGIIAMLMAVGVADVESVSTPGIFW